MANITLNKSKVRQFGGTPPYGNVTHLTFGIAANAGGVVINSSQKTALAIADVIDLGALQEGMRLDDASIFVQDAMKASTTCSLGFKYEDGVDSTEVPQDAAYFGTSLSLASVGRVRANTGKLVTLPKPARLIMTMAGATQDEASVVNVLVTGELTGPR